MLVPIDIATTRDPRTGHVDKPSTGGGGSVLIDGMSLGGIRGGDEPGDKARGQPCPNGAYVGGRSGGDIGVD
jgi:hypothetical protein